MALFNVRLPDELATRFDAWAASAGGRSVALRRLMANACTTPAAAVSTVRQVRPLKLTVRLTAVDGLNLTAAAAGLGLTPNAWAAGVLRHRLQARPTFPRQQMLALIAIQAEYRRIGVNLNQIARALNTAVMAGEVLDLEMVFIDELQQELRAHWAALGEVFVGVLAYWAGEGAVSPTATCLH